MRRKVKAKIKGNFSGIAIVILDNNSNIEEVDEVLEVDEVDDCEVIEEIYQVGG